MIGRPRPSIRSFPSVALFSSVATVGACWTSDSPFSTFSNDGPVGAVGGAAAAGGGSAAAAAEEEPSSEDKAVVAR